MAAGKQLRGRHAAGGRELQHQGQLGLLGVLGKAGRAARGLALLPRLQGRVQHRVASGPPQPFGDSLAALLIGDAGTVTADLRVQRLEVFLCLLACLRQQRPQLRSQRPLGSRVAARCSIASTLGTDIPLRNWTHFPVTLRLFPTSLQGQVVRPARRRRLRPPV